MTEYFTEDELVKAKEQKKKSLIIYFIALSFYIIISIIDFVIYFNFPYKSSQITVVKLIQYSFSVIFIIFSFIYLGIIYKRVNKYYKKCLDMKTGIRETSIGNFLGFDEELQYKDGVDFKSLIFIEWNKYKKDFFKRKVLIFFEKPFPEIPEKANVSYVTQGNVLISFEII